MNHTEYKFYTATIVFVLLVAGVLISTKFASVNMGAMNIGMLLVNSLLLLVIVGILLQIHEQLAHKKKK